MLYILSPLFWKIICMYRGGKIGKFNNNGDQNPCNIIININVMLQMSSNERDLSNISLERFAYAPRGNFQTPSYSPSNANRNNGSIGNSESYHPSEYQNTNSMTPYRPDPRDRTPMPSSMNRVNRPLYETRVPSPMDRTNMASINRVKLYETTIPAPLNRTPLSSINRLNRPLYEAQVPEPPLPQLLESNCDEEIVCDTQTKKRAAKDEWAHLDSYQKKRISYKEGGSFLDNILYWLCIKST